jgi:hypothetical protein
MPKAAISLSPCGACAFGSSKTQRRHSALLDAHALFLSERPFSMCEKMWKTLRIALS